MIELIATAESLKQGKDLLDAGADAVLAGEEDYGLRLAGYLTDEELSQLADYAHQQGKKLIVAAQAILHNDKINRARDYLSRMKETGADLLMVGDTGLIQILKEEAYQMPYIYDASVLTTSAGQVNFWAKYGAVGAMVAREVPLVELEEMAQLAEIPLVMQVYGASCIHQSGRMLLDNYFSYVGKDREDVPSDELFLSSPGEDDTHYSILQDDHGSHVFANNDLNLMEYLPDLLNLHIHQWYLDGVFCHGQKLVDMVNIFDRARQALENDQWTSELAAELSQEVADHHPENRELSTGFFLFDKDTVR